LLAKRAANIPDTDEVKIVVFPHKKTLWQMLAERGLAENSDQEAARSLAAVRGMMHTVQPLTRQLHALGIDQEDSGDDVLRMPEVETGR